MNKAQQILHTAQKYNNTDDMLFDMYKIKSTEKFDAVIVAPSWIPEKIFKNYDVEIVCMSKHTYISSYIVQFGNYRLVWLQCASGASNFIDHTLLFANSTTDKFIFLGAVGGLVETVKLGDIITPSESLAFTGANFYLENELTAKTYGNAVKPHNMIFVDEILDKANLANITVDKRKVFCTDSIICEYSFLDKIKSTGAQAIEMETAAFYKCMELMDKNGIAFLCVSDNSALSISLTSRTDEELAYYHNSREKSIPRLIEIVCEYD